MNLVNHFNDEEMKYIRLMCILHTITKKYLLIAEEIAEDGELFLQPLKEHRDAYDHLMRCYGIYIIDNKMSTEEKLRYEIENLKKAFGHEYRAFFDTADWLTYILRKWIRLKLKSCGEEICNKEFNNYSEIKLFINELPQKVAALREKKDVGNLSDNENSLVDEIEEYRKILDQLIELKKNIALKIGL